MMTNENETLDYVNLQLGPCLKASQGPTHDLVTLTSGYNLLKKRKEYYREEAHECFQERNEIVQFINKAYRSLYTSISHDSKSIFFSK